MSTARAAGKRFATETNAELQSSAAGVQDDRAGFKSCMAVPCTQHAPLIVLPRLRCAAAAPKSRLKYLQTPATPWQQLLVYEVGQQGALAGPYHCCSSSTGSGGESAAAAGCSSSMPAAGSSEGTLQGSAAAATAAADSNSSSGGGLQEALQLPQMAYSHLVYVCCK